MSTQISRTRTSARRSRPTTSRSASSSPTSSGSTSSPPAASSTSEVLPGDQRLLGGGRAAVAADAPAGRARPARRGHPGLRLPGHEPAGPRTGEHGAAPRRRQPRHVPRRPVGAGDEVDRAARLRGAEAALAAGDGSARGDRRLRADRARRTARTPSRSRRQRRRDGDDWVLDGAKRWIGNGSIADVVVVWARVGRGRPGQGLPRRDRTRPGSPPTTMDGKGASRAIWQARDRARRRPRAPRCTAARRATRSRTPAACSSPRARRAPGARSATPSRAYDAALTYSKQRTPVRQAAVRLPDRPGAAGEDARRGDRHAALLHAARATGGGRPAHRHDRRPGQAQQHAQGAGR